ncbi:MAG: hypothetical protein OEN01_12520, partial [Candidatus Krumholzibacteria bacterium]|nr:hypothetical protein [Candidatus Krumholzibacteria bacterium]
MTTLRYNSSSGAALLLLSADVSLSDRISGQTDSLGVRIEQVASCTEVLERLRGGGYQLLIFDADGVVGKPAQYLLEIRRTHPDLSIVVTATDVSQRLLLELIHIGVSDFVPKSVDPATLQAAIRSYCQPLVEDSSNTRVFNLTHTTSPPADYRQSESSGKILRATQDLQALNKTL